jgi:hypothetical protein
MSALTQFSSAGRWLVRGIGLAVLSYAGYAGYTWLRYGHAKPPQPDQADPLLDRFMPSYDVVERHRVRVAAPADVTLAAAAEMDLLESPIIRATFVGRDWIMGSSPAPERVARGLLAEVRALGWGTLAERPGREVVMGAVTQPWVADVVFRPLPPDEFAAFNEPGYVKIAWTLRADPVTAGCSVFRTETRAVATDPSARARFRRYWSFLSPGISLIRWASLGPLKADAERRVREAAARTPLKEARRLL